MDGKSKWRRSGELAVTSLTLADTDEKTVPPALKAALDPTGLRIPSVLREADAALTQARNDTPDGGGLVVAFGQSAARAYAQILQKITGEEPAVAVSDEPEASRIIKGFADSDRRWIVAVQTVAEGVDIPRLAVGVYASRIRTRMFFIQVAGRFVRLRGKEDETTACLFVPSIQPLLSYAQGIKKTVDAVLADEERRVRETHENDGGDPDEPLSLLPVSETVGSSQAVHHTTIASGESITPEEMNYAKSVMNRAGSAPRGTNPEYVALVLRTAEAGSAVPPQRPVETDQAPLADQRHDVRRLLRREVGRYSIVANKSHKYIHAELNMHFGDTTKPATLQTLMKRIELLGRWLEE